MSSTKIDNRKTPPDVDPSPSERPENTLPTLVGYEAAAAYLNSRGVPVSPRFVRGGVESGQLRSALITRKLVFSEAALIEWIHERMR